MRDGRSEILITAIFFSVMVHIGTMFYAKTKVMTEVAPSSPRTDAGDAQHPAAGHRKD